MIKKYSLSFLLVVMSLLPMALKANQVDFVNDFNNLIECLEKLVVRKQEIYSKPAMSEFKTFTDQEVALLLAAVDSARIKLKGLKSSGYTADYAQSIKIFLDSLIDDLNRMGNVITEDKTSEMISNLIARYDRFLRKVLQKDFGI